MKLVLGIFLGIVLTINLSAQETGCVEGDCENGYGVYKTSTYTYYGSFLDGKKHFWGCQDYESSKQLYCGNYSEGDKHLFGTYYFYDGDNDFFMGLYDRGKQLRTGFYIDASAASGNGAISMRREGVKIDPIYSISRNGQGCVAGDCKNGKGVYVSGNGRIYSGGFINGRWNGWGCYQILNDSGEYITEITCGMRSEGRLRYNGYSFHTDKDSYVANSNGVQNTSNLYIGLYDGALDATMKTGIYTASIEDEKERNSLQFRFGEADLGSIGLSGATADYDIKCMYGKCKEQKDGYSVKSNYNNGDWFGYEFSGNYSEGLLNGYACQYSPKFPELADKSNLATSEILVCGNFRNGKPMYFSSSFYGGSETVDEGFYLGLHDGYSWVPHGVYAYKGGNDGWVLETANFED